MYKYVCILIINEIYIYVYAVICKTYRYLKYSAKKDVVFRSKSNPWRCRCKMRTPVTTNVVAVVHHVTMFVDSVDGLTLGSLCENDLCSFCISKFGK